MGMHSDGILGAELRNSRTQQKDTQVAEAVDFFICNGGMQRELAVAPLDSIIKGGRKYVPPKMSDIIRGNLDQFRCGNAQVAL